MDKERICNNCGHWVPNGSPLGIGYCTMNKWAYRKPTQSCKDKYEQKETMKVKVTCRYGIEYEVEFYGSKGACLRSIDLMGKCCCWVCHNRGCERPRNEVLKDCGKACALWTKKPYCEASTMQYIPTETK